MSKIKWQLVFKAKASVLFQWYIFEGQKEKYFKTSLGIQASLENSKIVSDEIFIDLNEWSKLESLFVTAVKKDKKFLNKFIDRCYLYSDELINTSRKVGSTRDLQQLENKQLLSLYQSYQDSVMRLMPFMNGVLVLDNVLKKEIAKVFVTDLGIEDKKKQDYLLSKLVVPKKKSYFVKETEALLKIALKLQEDSKIDVERDIQDYLKKYAWMTCIAYLRPFQTREGVIKKINDLLGENPKEKLQQARRIRKEIRESYQKGWKQIETSSRLTELIRLAQELIYLQTYRMDVLFLAHFHAYLLLEAVGKRLGLPVSELVYLTGKEIIDVLKEKAGPDKEEIKKRMKNYALIEIGGKYTLLAGKQVKKAVLKIIKETVVTGIVANSGRATGQVKIVVDVEDISKVKRGDIIISPMTHPKLVVALAKACGIITDLGGILCHAAIVSREFGIPCLVGTKNATKVFKDGDLVELNAYEGTARKL